MIKVFVWTLLILLVVGTLGMGFCFWKATAPPQQKINCTEYPPVDGAGRPDICK